MKVTFRSNSHVAGFLPGRIYVEELTPWLEAILKQDLHLQLIDPPTLNPVLEPVKAPVLIPVPTPVVAIKPEVQAPVVAAKPEAKKLQDDK